MIRKCVIIFRMACTCECLFQTEGKQSWLKCWLAITLTREALLDFVKTEIEAYHKATIKKLPDTSTCKTWNPESSSNHTDTHTCDDSLKNLIQNINLCVPPWKNSNQNKWCNSAWEFAKCFIPAKGYIDSKSIAFVDLNAVLNIILNCKPFQNYFPYSFNNDDSTLKKVSFRQALATMYVLLFLCFERIFFSFGLKTCFT